MNHTSVIDDPVLMGALVGIKPIVSNRHKDSIFQLVFEERHRWGLCSKEIWKAAYTGPGKALPIVRGEGINQPRLIECIDRLNRGDWVHVFPEGRVGQTGELGIAPYHKNRSPERMNEIGRLKWGVGKMIAHVRGQDNGKPPTLIPMYHVGMEVFAPQEQSYESNELKPISSFHRYQIRFF